MSPDEIKAKLKQLAPWHFNIEVAPGIWTADANSNKGEYGVHDFEGVGVVDPLELKDLLQVILPRGGVKGNSYLDVGCNGGGYVFLAHELGAKRAFGFDVRDHWINQCKFIQSVKFPSAKGLDFKVEDVQKANHPEPYDVTLFKGVFYHLPDPIGMLIDLCKITKRAIIVDTASRNDIPEHCLMSEPESTTHVMSGVDGLCWYPGGPQALKPIFTWAGFPATRIVYNQKGAQTGRRRGRFRVIAARNEADFADYDAWRERAGPAIAPNKFVNPSYQPPAAS